MDNLKQNTKSGSQRNIVYDLGHILKLTEFFFTPSKIRPSHFYDLQENYDTEYERFCANNPILSDDSDDEDDTHQSYILYNCFQASPQQPLRCQQHHFRVCAILIVIRTMIHQKISPDKPPDKPPE